MIGVDAGRTSGERSEVTSVISHNIREGNQAAYENWLKKIVPIAAKFPGHRGVNIIRPAAGATEYTIVLHFDTIDNLRAWLDSDVRRKLIDKVLPLFAGEDRIEIKTGLEFWFTPRANQQRVRPFKQFLVTLSVIFPLTLLIPFLLAPVFERFSILHSHYVRVAIIDAIIVALITYVIMPRYVRLISKWLYR